MLFWNVVCFLGGFFFLRNVCYLWVLCLKCFLVMLVNDFIVWYCSVGFGVVNVILSVLMVWCLFLKLDRECVVVSCMLILLFCLSMWWSLGIVLMVGWVLIVLVVVRWSLMLGLLSSFLSVLVVCGLGIFLSNWVVLSWMIRIELLSVILWSVLVVLFVFGFCSFFKWDLYWVIVLWLCESEVMNFFFFFYLFMIYGLRYFNF